MAHPPRQPYSGAGLGRSPLISRRICSNSSHRELNYVEDGVAAWCATLAPIFTSFPRRLVSDHCATASGNARVGMKLVSGIGADTQIVELQLEAAVEIEPESIEFGFPRW